VTYKEGRSSCVFVIPCTDSILPPMAHKEENVPLEKGHYPMEDIHGREHNKMALSYFSSLLFLSFRCLDPTL
jgi:hypothetical protein